MLDKVNSIDHISRDKFPKRIICLVPSLTELLYDLNLEEEVVGITKFCEFPPHFRKTKVLVGGTKNIKLERIKELKPDLIICNKEENTEEIISDLLPVAPIYLCDVKNLKDNALVIEQIGKICGRNTEASNLIQKINFELNDFQTFLKGQNQGLKVAYFIWYQPWMAAGSDTFIQSMLEINKFENIYSNKERYPAVEPKKIRLEGDPEVIFLSSEPFPFGDKHAFELGRFTHHAKTVFVDGSYFSWYGSRVSKSFQYFKKLQLELNS